mmetsp:Transcript_70891/g.112647  ORF Transcript_70891/g.112647 Transcript_70891/m.112647 type:complete len:502 (+) Transcript_70891:255-1760(+)
MPRARKRGHASCTNHEHANAALFDDETKCPATKRHKLSTTLLAYSERDCVAGDDDTLKSHSCSTASTCSSKRTSSKNHHEDDDESKSSSSSSSLGISELVAEYPSIAKVFKCQYVDSDLRLDPQFNLAQFMREQRDKQNAVPMIFDWSQLKPAANPHQLRAHSLKKQERGKYVRRDSLSSKQAAARRRQQNRESARRTRDRVRKYITVLELYYTHVQKVNSLLIKQLEVMAKHCCNQLSEQERQSLHMHEWPQGPSVAECLNAKPATISTTSTSKKNASEQEQSNHTACDHHHDEAHERPLENHHEDENEPENEDEEEESEMATFALFSNKLTANQCNDEMPALPPSIPPIPLDLSRLPSMHEHAAKTKSETSSNSTQCQLAGISNEANLNMTMHPNMINLHRFEQLLQTGHPPNCNNYGGNVTMNPWSMNSNVNQNVNRNVNHGNYGNHMIQQMPTAINVNAHPQIVLAAMPVNGVNTVLALTPNGIQSFNIANMDMSTM